MNVNFTLPVPPGWTRTVTGNTIVVEGNVPDKRDQWRNRRVKVTMTFGPHGLDRSGSLSVRQELWAKKYDFRTHQYEAEAWRKRGAGGHRTLGTLLDVLVHNGERGW